MAKKSWLEILNSKHLKFYSNQSVSFISRRTLLLLWYQWWISVIGSEEMGVNDLLYTSIRKSDLDLRKTLYQNIVLSGGSTLFKGIWPNPYPNYPRPNRQRNPKLDIISFFRIWGSLAVRVKKAIAERHKDSYFGTSRTIIFNMDWWIHFR